MVLPVEEQMHQFLIEHEERRCKDLEAKNATSKNTVKRRKIPKPWKRPSEVALCQDSDLLVMVDEYDYDLSDGKFQEYCKSRGILHVTGTIGSKRWTYFLDHKKTKSEFLSDPYFQYAEEVDGKSHKFTKKEMDADWRVFLIGRAALQDCWELYSKQTTR